MGVAALAPAEKGSGHGRLRVPDKGWNKLGMREELTEGQSGIFHLFCTCYVDLCNANLLGPERLREVACLAQGHTAGRCWAEIQTLCLSVCTLFFPLHQDRSLLEVPTLGCDWAQRDVPLVPPKLSKSIHSLPRPLGSLHAGWRHKVASVWWPAEVALCHGSAAGPPHAPSSEPGFL